MSQLIPLFTAFGLGSIVTALIQAWLTQRSKDDERRFREKQAAYIGLLDSLHQAAVNSSDQAAKGFAHWQARCDLVAPKTVRDTIRNLVAQYVETNKDAVARESALEAMKSAMRADLRITK